MSLKILFEMWKLLCLGFAFGIIFLGMYFKILIKMFLKGRGAHTCDIHQLIRFLQSLQNEAKSQKSRIIPISSWFDSLLQF